MFAERSEVMFAERSEVMFAERSKVMYAQQSEVISMPSEARHHLSLPQELAGKPAGGRFAASL